MEKICTKCGSEKLLEDFYRSTSTKDGYQGYCKICHRERMRQWGRDNRGKEKERNRRWRVIHGEEVNLRRRQKRESDPEYVERERVRRHADIYKNHKMADEYKAFLGCFICGESQPHRLVFHHLRPGAKDLVVANRLHNGFLCELQQLELEKCIVLCANCHLDVHHWMRSEMPWSQR